jgi:hypothetical protein
MDNTHANLPQLKGSLLMVLVILTTMVFSSEHIEKIASAAAGETPFETSWIGNSLGGKNVNGIRWNHVQQNCNAAWVAPDGTVFCNSTWDEGVSEAGVYRGGATIGRLQNVHCCGGHAVTGNGSRIFIAASDGTHGQGISVFSQVDFGGLNVTGITHNDLTNFRPTQGGGAVTGLAVIGSELFATIESQNVVEVYRTSDLGYLRSFSVTAPGAMVADSTGRLWIAMNSQVRAYGTDGQPLDAAITEVAAPTALGLDATNPSHLLIGDDGQNAQQVSVYDISGVPIRVDTIGTAGGVWAAPTPGRVGPLRFAGITGVGIDASGALHVIQDHPREESVGTGTNIDVYERSGGSWTRAWQLLGLEFIDMAVVDLSGYVDGQPLDVYTADEHFTVDLSKPAGEQWTWVGVTTDRFTSPGDPRLHDEARVPLGISTLGGQKYLVVTGMYASTLYFYKPVPGAETWGLAAAVELGDQGEGHLAGNGDLWYTRGRVNEGIYTRSFSGTDGNGNPTFGPEQTIGILSPFEQITRVRYDAGKDALFAAGFTPERPKWASSDKVMGTVLARYDNVSQGGNRAAAWTTVLPYDASNTIQSGFVGLSAMDIAGDRVYATALTHHPGESQARIWSYDQATGAEVASWVPGSVTGDGGWIDVLDGISAEVLPSGETIIFQEEGFQAKVMMYRLRAFSR